MYALVRSGGRQYRVEPGKNFKVDKLTAKPDSALVLDQVLMVSDDDDVTLGAPLIDGANIACTVVRHERGPKVRVFRFKAKKGYRKRSGQRRDLTVLHVDEVSIGGKTIAKADAAAKPKAKAKSKAAAKPKAKAKARAAAKPKAKAKSKAAAKPKAKAKSKAAAKPRAKSKAKASAKAKSKAKSKSKAAAKAKSKSSRK
ncbi:MAG TPA: 50S ribosomal protein L21 [Chloroflexota bacterium]|nr:50S ribosomal protein L21 [Chloroflexota bacterium]